MPSFTTHCIAGDVAIAQTKSDLLRKIVKKYHASFLNGCQGPDFLAFYHILPIYSQKKAKVVREYSHFFHYNLINEMFTLFLKEVKANRDEELIAYLAGLLCHHAVDSICHPYIIYNIYNNKDYNGYCHEYFEGQLDYGCLQMFNLNQEVYNVCKETKLKRGSKVKLAKLWNACLNKLDSINILDSQTLQKCFEDMWLTEIVLRDTTGKKIKLIQKLEKWCGFEGRGTSIMVPREYDNKLDAFNYRNDVWRHCSTGEESCESFESLFNKAINETKRRFETFELVLNKEVEIEKILTLIGNRGYDSGIDNGKLLFFKE